MQSIRAISTNRYVMEAVCTPTSESDRAELDSHADTCVGGSNVAMLEATGVTVSVSSFTDELDTLQKIPVATCVGAYDCPTTGSVILLTFHEMLYFGDRLSTSLLNPNQLRNNGHKVEDCPTKYDPLSRHSIITHCGEVLPLQMAGVISYLDMRLPTPTELEDHTLQRIEMTSPEPWTPHENEDHSISLRGLRTIASVSIQEDNSLYPRLLGATSTHDLPAGDQHDSESAYCADCYDFCCEHAAGAIIGNICVSCVKTFSKVGHVADPAAALQRGISSARVRNRSATPISPEELSKRWLIGRTCAENTLKVTTQKGVRKYKHPAMRRFSTHQPYLQRRRLHGKFYSDTCFFKSKSIRSYTCAQVTTDGNGFSHFWPMEDVNRAHEGLQNIILTDGVPDTLITDEHAVHGGQPHIRNTKWQALAKEYGILQKFTEPYSPWQNLAEQEIKEIKRDIRRFTYKFNSPRQLWCYLGELVASIRRLKSSMNARLRERTPYEVRMGYTPDISPYISFHWYEFVYYLDDDGETYLGRWLGPAKDHSNGGAYWILPKSGRPIVRSTVSPIPEEDINTEEKKDERNRFNQLIEEHFNSQTDLSPEYEDIFDNQEDELPEPVDPEEDMPEADEHTPEEFDEYIGMQVLLPVAGEQYMGTVKQRIKDSDGKPVGTRNDNPILDTRQYEVEFADGNTEEYTTNLIAENLYSQIDDEGRSHGILEEIIDHRTDGTERKKSNTSVKYRTTRGWEFLVQFRGGDTEWVPLRNLKESYPVQVAEYAKANRIDDEPAFTWWTPYVLRKKDRIIKKVKSKYWRTTHKYGIRVPKSIDEALRLDKENGNDLWQKSIEKEFSKVKVAFEFNDKDEIPVGHKKLELHWIFDIKLGSLTRKSRLVANGNEHSPPSSITFSSVVARDSVRIFFLMAALLDVSVLSCDIENAYLTAPINPQVKLYIVAGTEFGKSNVGRPAKVVRALYGLKGSGADFRAHLARTIRAMGFQSTKADPDVWMRRAVKPDGTPYYEYMCTYVDDILCSSVAPRIILTQLEKSFKLKDGSVEEPKLYLGADIMKWRIDGCDDPDKVRWAMSSTNYCTKAIDNVKEELGKVGRKLRNGVKSPLATGYRPELDLSPELDPERQSYYQGLIGVLRWLTELGRLDILTPVSMMSRYLVSAREGHLEQLFHIFAYLQEHNRSTMVFDDNEPWVDENRFRRCDWGEFYPDAKEQIPKDAPEALGPAVVVSCFVDADHAGCRATRRSHTGVLIFVNRAPIVWYSRRQNCVEGSTFGSEFVAMKTAVELVEALRYKLRMFGIKINGATNVYCDNDGVVKNSSNPDSTLGKRHNAIAYHYTREACANDTIRVAKENGETNLADILTKLMGGLKLRRLISQILW